MLKLYLCSLILQIFFLGPSSKKTRRQGRVVKHRNRLLELEATRCGDGNDSFWLYIYAEQDYNP